jgi:hypothetical protein
MGADGWTDWIWPASQYRFRCCDCALVHLIEFHVDGDGDVSFRVRRDARSTAACRRWLQTLMDSE